MDDHERFIQMHYSQLKRIPQHLWRGVHSKLQSEVYDAGKYFMLSPGRKEWKVVVTHRGHLSPNDSNSVFLIDHAWTFQPHLAMGQLHSIPGLAGRMASLMDLDGFPCLSGEEADRLAHVCEDGEEEEEENGEDIEEKPEKEEVKDSLKEESSATGFLPPPPPSQSFQPSTFEPRLPPPRKLPASSSSDSSSDGGERRRPNLSEQIKVSYQERFSDIIRSFIGVMPAPVEGGGEVGYNSLSGYESYAGYESCDIEREEVEAEKEEEERGEGGGGGEEAGEDAAGVILIPELTNQIESPGLEAPPTDDLVARIQEALWRFCHPYVINNSPVPVWYVMDEFGSRIPHSDEPTVAMTSFFFVPRQLTFCLIWPLRDLTFGDLVTRDYLEDIGAEIREIPLQRACHLIPWSGDNHLTLDDPLWQGLPQCTVPQLKERCDEQYPDPSLPLSSSASPPPHAVFTDMELIKSFLDHPSFTLVNKEEEADIFWYNTHFKEFSSLRANCYVNQFACENVLTCKDLLIETAKQAARPATSDKVGVASWAGPDWLPESYNLLYELPRLVQRHRLKELRGEPNWWIVKPWNLGRGMDIHITSSLHHLVRLAQAGPKVVSRYISDPVLFHRPEIGDVKFDLRYIILLKSVDPFEAYVYDVFWLRFANKPFSLEDFYDYEKHFTVMNYQKGVELKQIHYDDFIPMFERQFPLHPWNKVQETILEMFSELMKAACSRPPPNGLAPSHQCCGLYGIDLMLEWNWDVESGTGMRPQLLEVNFSPDNVRACRYHPQFYNHVFQVLFLDQSEWNEDIPITKL